jgi:hypothetical protein
MLPLPFREIFALRTVAHKGSWYVRQLLTGSLAHLIYYMEYVVDNSDDSDFAQGLDSKNFDGF